MLYGLKDLSLRSLFKEEREKKKKERGYLSYPVPGCLFTRQREYQASFPGICKVTTLTRAVSLQDREKTRAVSLQDREKTRDFTIP